MTCYGDFPEELQRLIDELAEDGFDIVYGEVEEEGGGPGFTVKQDETTIHVEDWMQTWAVTLRSPDRPDYDDTWAYPSRVRREIQEWLKAGDEE